MAVKLRLKRMGSKQKPFYRIVAADARFPRDGRFIETVGTYDPIKGADKITVDEAKALDWLKKVLNQLTLLEIFYLAVVLWQNMLNQRNLVSRFVYECSRICRISCKKYSC